MDINFPDFRSTAGMIVSLHLPKTAGTSFGTSLEKHFGAAFMRDYDDRPINTPPYARNLSALQAAIANAERDFDNIRCIHGHFLPLKYLLLATRRDIRFITWLRHPVERLLSHYYYWRRNYNPANAAALHRKVVEENWSIERFCLGPELRNIYGQFLWGFPIENFDFIGLTEYYTQDFAYFTQRYLNFEVNAEKVNVGDKQTSEYSIDSAFRNEIEAFHDRDMQLYRQVLTQRLIK